MTHSERSQGLGKYTGNSWEDLQQETDLSLAARKSGQVWYIPSDDIRVTAGVITQWMYSTVSC
jgi:hypothetical protein